jgi:hypothetical protein
MVKKGVEINLGGFVEELFWKDDATYFMAIVQCGKFDYKGD